MEDEVITIREAAWLTDNTYVYEQIVKAIGQSLYSAKGDVRTVTQHDYLLVLLRLVKVRRM
jgi:F-box protein 1 (cyclin F)